MQRGKFITFEGIDGAGKSTHLAWLASFLRDKGLEVIVTREPGSTALGEQLRQLLLDHRQAMHAETETLLMFAARREHLDKVILPALERGAWVISDRFTDASFAYQGGGRGVPSARLEILEQWVQKGFSPDLTVYFDVPVTISRQRVQSARTADRFELEPDLFFERVRQAYLQRAKQFSERIRVVDGSLSLEEVRTAMVEVVEKFWSAQASSGYRM
ncbi:MULTISPECIES: dTMP kinase [Nitrosomonas]|uniref:Thymidylate kinase n=1 Tax=Nitrosomonas eutropha (strain DSM 101675 / C91 / Nm57) TaxID=335283 RepID=KTHY_NITEC|nr:MULTISPECIES: dTMP kinase [Nitrosomonas]Q0AIL5.1 RecName: Full=Thymidylate kinase; AltName: Full=dTMP kinase [Nitrosomonas eutropha C91]ABI58811.1 thymidylate kinase [Nitrosomonas eutropha C91]MXS79705.1 dTMP kinase [Nitrosomonas sp. GH22]